MDGPRHGAISLKNNKMADRIEEFHAIAAICIILILLAARAKIIAFILRGEVSFQLINSTMVKVGIVSHQNGWVTAMLLTMND